ncbi:CBS domain-containing protein [Saccharothrix sp.]|uniref:CBS domain-containing protein n=1 Tax=Saccharothrix sp. TaxID=1873460 RepID=UPI0028126017|nr:CBS domain-containing protein [Saccharothrix sp.]
MQAGELAVDFPAITADSSAVAAVRKLVSERLPGLIVVEDGKPVTALPAYQVARFLVPLYMRVDPALARVVAERHADQLCARLVGKQVRDLLPEGRWEPLVVRAGETVMQVAELMERAHSPLVAVVGEDGTLLGAITLFELLDATLRELSDSRG